LGRCGKLKNCAPFPVTFERLGKNAAATVRVRTSGRMRPGARQAGWRETGPEVGLLRVEGEGADRSRDEVGGKPALAGRNNEPWARHLGGIDSLRPAIASSNRALRVPLAPWKGRWPRTGVWCRRDWMAAGHRITLWEDVGKGAFQFLIIDPPAYCHQAAIYLAGRKEAS